MAKRKKYGRGLKRIISAMTTKQRFQEFYNSLVAFCKEVKVLFCKIIGSNQVHFEIFVKY